MRNRVTQAEAVSPHNLRPTTQRSTRPRANFEESSDSTTGSQLDGKRSNHRNRKNTVQVQVLKDKFDFNRLWTKKEIKALAEETGLTQSQVYKWRWDYRKKLQADMLEEMSARSLVTEEVLLPSQLEWEVYELQRSYKNKADKEDTSLTPSGLLVLTK